MTRGYPFRLRVDHWEGLAANYIKGIISARHTLPLDKVAPQNQDQLTVESVDEDSAAEFLEDLEDYSDSDFDELVDEDAEMVDEDQQHQQQTQQNDQRGETSSISTEDSSSCDSSMSLSD